MMSDDAQFQLRDARDRLVDFLGIGETFPMQDVVVPRRFKVPYNTAAQIPISFSQRGVTYELHRAGKDEPVVEQGETAEERFEVSGTGGRIRLRTPRITEKTRDARFTEERPSIEVTYRILARKLASGRQAYLRQEVTVEVGLESSLDVEIDPQDADKLQPLDPTKIPPSPTDPQLMDCGTQVNIQVRDSQEGVEYRLVCFRAAGVAAPFQTEIAFSEELDKEVFSAALRNVFEEKEFPVSDDIEVRIKTQSQAWCVIDSAERRMFSIKKTNNHLDILPMEETELSGSLEFRAGSAAEHELEDRAFVHTMFEEHQIGLPEHFTDNAETKNTVWLIRNIGTEVATDAMQPTDENSAKDSTEAADDESQQVADDRQANGDSGDADAEAVAVTSQDYPASKAGKKGEASPPAATPEPQAAEMAEKTADSGEQHEACGPTTPGTTADSHSQRHSYAIWRTHFDLEIHSFVEHVGNLESIALPTPPLQEDTDIWIRATKIYEPASDDPDSPGEQEAGADDGAVEVDGDQANAGQGAAGETTADAGSDTGDEAETNENLEAEDTESAGEPEASAGDEQADAVDQPSGGETTADADAGQDDGEEANDDQNPTTEDDQPPQVPTFTPKTETVLLDTMLSFKVRANPAVDVSVAPSNLIDHNGQPAITICGSQKSVAYRLFVYDLTEQDFVQDANPEFEVVEVCVEGSRHVRVPRHLGREDQTKLVDAITDADTNATTTEGSQPKPRGPWRPPTGFAAPSGDEFKQGTGEVLHLSLESNNRDKLVIVEARKAHQEHEIVLESVELEQAEVILVRPDHTQRIELSVPVEGVKTVGPIQVSGGQPGVCYYLGKAPGDVEFSDPACFAKDEAQVAEPGEEVRLDEPLDLPATLNARAVWPRTGVAKMLESKAQIPAPPEVHLDQDVIDYNSPAKIIVESSVVGDRYELQQTGDTIDISSHDQGEMELESEAASYNGGTDYAATHETAAGDPKNGASVPDSEVTQTANEAAADDTSEPGGDAYETDNPSERDTDTDQPAPSTQDGNGEDLVFETKPLTEDTVIQLNVTQPEDDGLAVERIIKLAVTLRPNTGLTVYPSEATVVDHNAEPTIRIAPSQIGVTYQLTAGGQPTGEPGEGNGGELTLTAGPLTAEITFVIRATRTENSEVAADLAQQVSYIVRPDARLTVRTADTEVNPGANTTIFVDGSQMGVQYQLTVDGDPLGELVEGTGATICLPTETLITDTTFVVRATRDAHAAAWADLAQSAVVHVRLKERLEVRVRETTAYAVMGEVDYGDDTNIAIVPSEPGVEYQLTVNGNPVGKPAEGNGSTIFLPTGPLLGDIEFVIRATRIGNTENNIDLQPHVLVRVLPDKRRAVAAAQTIIDYGAQTVVTLAASQEGVSYQLSANGVPVGASVAGNGNSIELPTGPLTNDTTFHIRATRVGTPDLQTELQESVYVIVRPDTHRAVSITEDDIEH